MKTKEVLYDKVKELLIKYPELRNSDRKLLWATWYVLGLVTDGVIAKDNFYKAPSSESITRARRKVQENNPELQASEKVKKERIIKQNSKGTFVYREQLPII